MLLYVLCSWESDACGWNVTSTVWWHCRDIPACWVSASQPHHEAWGVSTASAASAELLDSFSNTSTRFRPLDIQLSKDWCLIRRYRPVHINIGTEWQMISQSNTPPRFSCVCVCVIFIFYFPWGLPYTFLFSCKCHKWLNVECSFPCTPLTCM